jgi:hypothetical protein
MIFEIDDQHLAWPKTTTMRHFFRIKIDQTGLGSRNYKTSLRYRESTRAQAIAIQSSADNAAITEGQCSRPIPWLGAIRVIAQKG